MADEKITKDQDDEEELIPVETPPEDDKAKAKAEDGDDKDGADEDDDLDGDDKDDADKGDAKLADSQDDHDDAIENANRKKRLQRKQRQKEARERNERELRFLREQTAQMSQRLVQLEGRTIHQSAAQIDQQLQAAINDARMAEDILGKAIEAGNGADAASALRLRDEANQRAWELKSAKERLTQRPADGPDPAVVSYAKQWLDANPWYDPQGRDEDSRITKAIDGGLVRDGYDPKSQEYWEELTRRVAKRLGTARADDDVDDEDDTGAKPQKKINSSDGRRKPPPQGDGRTHAPPSTRKEIYVTPERKQAMMDAGAWDDPVKRNKMLKAYQAYDRNKSAN